jgi:hypothetical protein
LELQAVIAELFEISKNFGMSSGELRNILCLLSMCPIQLLRNDTLKHLMAKQAQKQNTPPLMG